MAGPLLLRDVLLPRCRLHNYHRFTAGIAVTETPHRIFCCAPTNSEPGQADEKASYAAQISKLLRDKDLASHPRSDDPDYRIWKDKEEEILKDIEPIVRLIKDILHSRRRDEQIMTLRVSAKDLINKWIDKHNIAVKATNPLKELLRTMLACLYMDGEQLTAEDEKVVVEKLLAYHPRSEDKIGCGLESIMVDRHPQFRYSRCLFVVRTDGGWIDFSYQKCLREYIRNKYPSHAERFIREHLKRGSG